MKYGSSKLSPNSSTKIELRLEELRPRIGFGIFYDRPGGNTFFGMLNNPPFVKTAQAGRYREPTVTPTPESRRNRCACRVITR